MQTRKTFRQNNPLHIFTQPSPAIRKISLISLPPVSSTTKRVLSSMCYHWRIWVIHVKYHVIGWWRGVNIQLFFKQFLGHSYRTKHYVAFSLYTIIQNELFFPIALAVVDHCSMSALGASTQSHGIHPPVHLSDLFRIYLSVKAKVHIFLISNPDKTFLMSSKHICPRAGLTTSHGAEESHS